MALPPEKKSIKDLCVDRLRGPSCCVAHAGLVISASPHLRFSHGNTSVIYVRCAPPMKTGHHLSPLTPPTTRSSTPLKRSDKPHFSTPLLFHRRATLKSRTILASFFGGGCQANAIYRRHTQQTNR